MPVWESQLTGDPACLKSGRAEVGDDEIARLVEDTCRAADAGLIPSLTDRDSLLCICGAGSTYRAKRSTDVWQGRQLRPQRLVDVLVSRFVVVPETVIPAKG